MLRSADPSAKPFVARSGAFEHPGSRADAIADFLAAPVRSAGFFVRAWAAIPVVELSLRVLGYKRTLAWIEAVPEKPPSAARDLRHSRRRDVGQSLPRGASVFLGERLVRGAYRAHTFGGGCLPRSLVQYLLHRRDGTRARFVVGVRRPTPVPNETRGPGIEAHAWVETNDFVPPATATFASLFQSEAP